MREQEQEQERGGVVSACLLSLFSVFSLLLLSAVVTVSSVVLFLFLHCKPRATSHCARSHPFSLPYSLLSYLREVGSEGAERRGGMLRGDERGRCPEAVRLLSVDGYGLPPAAAAGATQSDAPALGEAVFGRVEREGGEALPRVGLGQVVVVVREAAVSQLRHPPRVHLENGMHE